ncbi:MAG: hypothetical protein AB7D51_12490 [Desulfovibrionaceae bacterium]
MKLITTPKLCFAIKKSAMLLAVIIFSYAMYDFPPGAVGVFVGVIFSINRLFRTCMLRTDGEHLYAHNGLYWRNIPLHDIKEIYIETMSFGRGIYKNVRKVHILRPGFWSEVQAYERKDSDVIRFLKAQGLYRTEF